jgi:pilus assembly protein Flp/PilA
MKKLLKILRADAVGATAVEYGVLIALISAVIIFSVQRLGSTLNTTFTDVNSLIASASSSPSDGGSTPSDPGGKDDTCCD